MYWHCSDCKEIKDLNTIGKCKQKGHDTVKLDKDGWAYGLDGSQTRIRDLGPNDEDRKQVIKARILGTDEVKAYDVEIEWKCLTCGETKTVAVKDDFRKMDIREPFCEKCHIKMSVGETHKSQIQKVLIQEPQEEVKGASPITIEANLFGERCLTTQPGDELFLDMKLRMVKDKPKDLTYRRVLDVVRIAPVSRAVEMPDDKEKIKFKECTLDMLVKSFAPEIFGMEAEKLAIIISLIGGRRIGDLRGDINFIFVGDPSVGKSRLLMFVEKVVTKSKYTSGRSTSAAGLLGGVDQLADSSRIPRAGPVVLCNGGVVCIDEMDKMNSYDSSSLHESMEKQTFSLTKIGINQTWETRTTIIGAANPRGSRYDPNLTILENIKITESLLSRFGLIFLVRDIADEERDSKIIDHIFKSREEKVETALSVDELKKFINYAKTFKPEITSDAERVIKDFYLDLRKLKQDGRALAIDTRTGEDLIRSATAFAKMRFSEKVEGRDAEMAINLLRSSLASFGMETPGELIANITNMEEIGDGKIILHLVKETPGILYDKLVESITELPEFGSEEKAKSSIDKMMGKKFIYQTVNGEVRPSKKVLVNG